MDHLVWNLSWLALACALLAGCAGPGTIRPQSAPPRSVQAEQTTDAPDPAGPPAGSAPFQGEADFVTAGQEVYRGFVLDNVLHSAAEGEIHYNLYVPADYDGSAPYALFFTLPGYEGLYFQGVGVNLRAEDFGFTAQDYDRRIIVVAP